MKKILLLLAFPAFAHAQTWVAADSKIKDVWTITQNRVPVSKQVCEQVQVPVYREEKADGGAVILGAIIGNAIGRAAGVDGGQAAGTIIGGIAGAEISKNNQDPDHYVTRQQCKYITEYKVDDKWEYSHSIIMFQHEGKEYQVRFSK